MPSRRIHKEIFATTPATGSTTVPAGSATTTTNLNPIDLSHSQGLLCELHVTTIGTDAIDKLDVKIQDASIDALGAQVWNTRGRFALISGTDSAPQTYRLNIQQAINIAQSEQAYRDTSETTEIASGTVVNGPFPGKARLYGNIRAGQSAQTASWRAQYVVTDANANSTWAGTLTLWAVDSSFD